MNSGTWLRDRGMPIEEAAIFTSLSSIVLCAELQGAVSLYLHVGPGMWVCLFVPVRLEDLPLTVTMAVRKLSVNGNMSLAIMLHLSRE